MEYLSILMLYAPHEAFTSFNPIKHQRVSSDSQLTHIIYALLYIRIASLDHFGHFHRLSIRRFTVSITDSDIYFYSPQLARVRKGTYKSTG